MANTFRSQFMNIHLNNPVKYGLLAAAASLFIISMVILGWQICIYCKRKTGKGTKAKKDDGETGPKKQYTEKSSLSTSSNSIDFLSISDEEEYLCIGKHDYKTQKLQEGMEKLNYYLQSNATDKLRWIQKRGNLVTDSMVYVAGKITFSLSYDNKQAQLHLTVAGASDLPGRIVSQSVDPFVRIKLMSSVQSEESTHQFILHQWNTKVVKNTRNPSFGEQFTCSIETHVLRKTTLKLEVWNVDKYSRRDILGEVRTSFSALNLSDTLKFCEELQKPQKDTVGEILVSLRYLPTAQRLEAGLLKVKSACLISNLNIGIYTRIDFYVNQRKQKHQKTSTKTKSAMTVFNEVISFTVGDSAINHSMIIISVYETSFSKDGARHLVGRAYVGRKKSREDDHWLSMLQCLRRPVAKWHPLLI
eukprot:gi/632941299/ref/XP_007885791.1/ PREDICTED: synaptotagmin-2-like [Callorhinchus milii]